MLFAAAVVIAVVATHKSSSNFTATTKGGQAVSKSDPYRQAEDPTAAKIAGVTYTVEGQHTHIEGKIKYDSTPPVGGNHSQYWADCTGTVYPKPIANENAVHMLEHGAVWITYNADKIKGAQLAKLKTYVSGVDRMAMSPYPEPVVADLAAVVGLPARGVQPVRPADRPVHRGAEVQPEDDAGVRRDLLAAHVHPAPEHVRAPAVDAGQRRQRQHDGQMSLDTDDPDLDVTDAEEVTAEPVGGRPLRLTLLAIIAIAVLVLAGTAGWLLRGGGSPGPTPSAVDAGFAQDMSTHHTQAVTMAGYERDTTTNSALRVLASDIETSQEFQIGQMQGWLDGWDKPRNNPDTQMVWMNHPVPAGQSHAGHGHRGPDADAPDLARQAARHPVPAADDPPPPGRHRHGAVRRATTRRRPTSHAWPARCTRCRAARSRRWSSCCASSAGCRCPLRRTDGRDRAARLARVIQAVIAGFAPVAQGIEHRPPEAGAQVRILPGAPRRNARDPGPGAHCALTVSLPRRSPGTQRVHIAQHSSRAPTHGGGNPTKVVRLSRSERRIGSGCFVAVRAAVATGVMRNTWHDLSRR